MYTNFDFTVMRNIKLFRKHLKLTQQQFWNLIGMTQSAGSRYENSRTIPKPILALLNAAYGAEYAAFTKTREVFSPSALESYLVDPLLDKVV